MGYTVSRLQTIRRPTREVMIGAVGVGGSHPIRLQSMTTSDTQDVAATVAQAVALAEAGCEIVRITAPNVTAARCLREIRAELDERGISVPLVADIHFLPAAALEAVEHVEKVRVNPGNYADRKKFAVREYSDAEYERELQRLHEAFSPLVKRCRELGRALRIGTNHGSLSDRIMNRYGDSPLGMVESALEFLRIAESHRFHNLILSMKASNPKVMIQAYRLLVERMAAEGMHYPLHLGVTEAGDGEDGRIKSAVGIGSLLLDGLGDTIRVSLTEDSVYEIPVARALADKVMRLWGEKSPPPLTTHEGLDPYSFSRQVSRPLSLGQGLQAGGEQPPRVILRLPPESAEAASVAALLDRIGPLLNETPPEGLLLPELPAETTPALLQALSGRAALMVVPCPQPEQANRYSSGPEGAPRLALLTHFSRENQAGLPRFVHDCRARGLIAALDLDALSLPELAPTLAQVGEEGLLVTLSKVPDSRAGLHPVGAYRALAAALRGAGVSAPLWIRATRETAVAPDETFLGRLLEASVLAGTLLCDGLGDLISVESEADPLRATRLAYNILQGAGARISKTEFVACPSCGRTLFDLQSTTQRIRAKTGHLKGVKIAIMGCIVNGPGEMADADFGYVGGAPGKINLYVGKTCVQYHIPQSEADARLIALIRQHGKWVDPEPEPLPEKLRARAES